MYIHNCPECGKQYSTQEKVSRVKCPYCGAETNVSYSDQQQSQWQQFGDQAASTVDVVEQTPNVTYQLHSLTKHAGALPHLDAID